MVGTYSISTGFFARHSDCIASETWIMRVATKDDQISAVKTFLDRSGESGFSIKIRKHYYHHTYSGHQQEGRVG